MYPSVIEALDGKCRVTIGPHKSAEPGQIVELALRTGQPGTKRAVRSAALNSSYSGYYLDSFFFRF